MMVIVWHGVFTRENGAFESNVTLVGDELDYIKKQLDEFIEAMAGDKWSLKEGRVIQSYPKLNNSLTRIFETEEYYETGAFK